MAQIGKGKRFANAAFSIDGNNLSFAGGFALRHLKRDVFMGLIAQPLIEISLDLALHLSRRVLPIEHHFQT